MGLCFSFPKCCVCHYNNKLPLKEEEKGNSKAVKKKKDLGKGKKKKKFVTSHAGNRTPATAVRAPDPNH